MIEILVIIFAILMITSRSAFNSVLFFLATLVGLGVIYFKMGANFISLIHIFDKNQ